ncbi:hypothetical protein MK852_19465 [Shewanella benthica]|nr:hypothetical protein [Shewanella benthica]
MYNESLERVNKIIDSLACISRVSRKSGFRFIYFGGDDDYRENVKRLIRDRILWLDDENIEVSDNEIETLVDRFITQVVRQNITDKNRHVLIDNYPSVWANITD